MDLFENVKLLAKNKGMSIPEFSEVIGIGKTSIYKWREHNPSLDVIAKVAEYFGVSIDYLLYGDTVPEWVANNGVIDIEFLLNNFINIGYGERKLTLAEIKRTKTILDALFLE